MDIRLFRQYGFHTGLFSTTGTVTFLIYIQSLYITCYIQLNCDENMSIILLLFIGLIVFLLFGKIISSASPLFISATVANDNVSKLGKENGTMMNEKNMTMLARNMTFGSSLDNAKMHLTEAIMDLEEGDTNGAKMQLKMTEEGIKMHEIEMMHMIMKQGNSTTESENKTP